MKKYFAIVSALVLAACAKESLPKGGDEALRTETLTARIVNTKVEVNAAGKFSWTAGDEIAVHRTVNGYETATLTCDGAFNVHLADGEARDGYAVYPASVATDAATLTVNLPTAYTIPKTGMADYSPLPMIAVNDPDSEDLVFHHMGGIIRLVLNKVPYETQKIVVNLGKKVTGTFTVNGPDTESPYIALADGAAEDIVFSLSSPVSSARQDDFVINIPVPVGTYEVVSVKLYDRYNQFILDQDKAIDVTVERADGYDVASDLYTDVSEIPLCFKMARDGQLIVTNPLGLTIEYSRDNAAWTSFNSDLTLDLHRGDQVYFRGNNTAYATNRYYNSSGHTNISTTSKCYIYGNIMSLITPEPEDFSILKTLTDPYTFCYLLEGELEGLGSLMSEPKLFNHPSFDLLLPATELAEYCYYRLFSFTGVNRIDLPATTMKQSCYNGMFLFCSKIETAPELPAMELADDCYECMFENCISLVNAPALPATEMAKECYDAMFSGCMNLTSAPELPALTLAKRCYQSMFSDCAKLEIAPSLPAETLAEYCYYNMFQDCSRLTVAPDLPATVMAEESYSYMFEKCTALVNAPSLPATTLAVRCYYGMFKDCTSLVRAPELPAETLPESGCYYEMFKGCTSLNYVKAMFITDGYSWGSGNLENWLSGVPETGTFVMNAAATYDPVTDAGVPSGWTIETASE